MERLVHGKGYQIANGSKQAAFLIDKPTLNSTHLMRRVVVAGELPRIPKEQRFHRPKDPALYKGPLVLFRQSPKPRRSDWGAIFCADDFAYNESFIGFSVAQLKSKSEALFVASYLLVLSYSELFLFYALLTSSQFGIERDAVLKEDIERFPLVPIENLSTEERVSIENCAQLLKSNANDDGLWQQIDDVVAAIYGLSHSDKEFIADTLKCQLPYTDNQNWAESPPNGASLDLFVRRANEVLAPYGERTGRILRVQRVAAIDTENWHYLKIESGTALSTDKSRPIALSEVLANYFWSSKIQFTEGDSLIVGFLAQNRYWTRSRGRALAHDLIQQSTGAKSTRV